MCGIVGTAFAPPARVFHSEQALNAIRSRGPDGAHWEAGDGFGFGHALLAITASAPAARQPMWDESHELVIVFNGEIYNHKQLRADLIARGVNFKTSSDTETLLYAYKHYGARVVHKLSGMFAFAVWDTRDQSLFLARDRVGEKPLFYAVQDGAFGFASTTRALGALGFVLEPDMSGLPTLLTFGHVRHGGTNYKGVAQLLPGHCLRVRSDLNIKPERYWRVSFEERAQHLSGPELKAELRRLVDASVNSMLDTTHDVALLLSGGIDSSITASVATRLGHGAPKTYSVAFPSDARYDESGDAKIVAEHLGTKHSVIAVGPECFDDIERMVDDCDGPFADSSFLALSALSKHIRQSHRVALGGDGADEVFVGYPRFLAAELASRTPSAALGLASLVAGAFAGDDEGTSRLSRVRRFARKAALPEAERLMSWISVIEPHGGGILTEQAMQLCDPREAIETHRELLASIPSKGALARTLHHNFESYLPDDLLVKADRASMMHGLELRAPFLDPTLVSFVAGLPNRYKRRGLTTKWLLREAYRSDLPASVFDKKKQGFGLPMATWFRGPLRQLLRDHLGPGARVFDYVREDYVSNLIARQDAGSADFGLPVFLLLTLEIWLRRQGRIAKAA